MPIKSALQATVDVQNTLPVKIEKGQLKIPLNSIKLSRQTAGQAEREHTQSEALN